MRLYSVLAAAIVATAAQVHSAHADSISTGVADWTLVSIQSLGAPPYIPGAATQGHSALPITPHSAWGSTAAIAALDPAAQWIGASSDGAQHAVWGWYTFELKLTDITPGQYTIFGSYSADNMVDSFKINGVEMVSGIPVASPSPIYGFNFTYDFATLANAPITITARVYNESDHTPPQFANYPTGPSGADSIENPLGFILAGEINRVSNAPSAVPTPAAALGGLALLPILAVSQLRRRRAATH